MKEYTLLTKHRGIPDTLEKRLPDREPSSRADGDESGFGLSDREEDGHRKGYAQVNIFNRFPIIITWKGGERYDGNNQ
ncbi:MAG TPA: hypothetical protein VN420_02610 [Candidatus Fimivivens sp.]|nr:hypothetical protein [Candidatus Fimivivens sp.]